MIFKIFFWNSHLVEIKNNLTKKNVLIKKVFLWGKSFENENFSRYFTVYQSQSQSIEENSGKTHGKLNRTKRKLFRDTFAWAFNLRRSSYCLRKRRRQKAHHSLSMSIPERLNWQLFLIKLKMKKIYLLPFLSDMCGNGFYQHLSSSELEHIQFEFDALRFKI